MKEVHDFFSGRELLENFGKLLLGEREGWVLGKDSFDGWFSAELEDGVSTDVGETVFESTAERDEVADIDLR